MKPEKQLTILELRDPVVGRVCKKFEERSNVGYKKYGVTMEEDPSELPIWLNHLQEELMDAVLYIQKTQEELAKYYDAKGKEQDG